MGNKVVKTISFNITKADDLKILEHIQKMNFSGYVKKLIWRDMKRTEKK